MSSSKSSYTTGRRLFLGIGTAVVIAVAFSIFLYVVSAAERSARTEDEYEVWFAFLNSELLDHDWAHGRCRVVLKNHTIRHFADDGTIRDTLIAVLSAPFRKKPLAEISAQTFRSFRIRNLWRESLAANLRLNAPYEVASQDDIKLFAKPEHFERRFPGNCGYVELSAVGFDAAHSEAFFRADHFCGLCGGGGYVVMGKFNGKWRVLKWDLSWVS